jgi:hypothetical protein
MHICHRRRVSAHGLKHLLITAGAVLLFPAVSASAQVVIAPSTPQIGSSNTVSADPTVPRPHTKPCTVQLFQNMEFADYNTKNYSYTPPANCPGPWSKVVFTADFTVTAGNQFDRTAQFYLGGANIFFGTTAEPGATLSPSWHVESDLTDLSYIFKTAQAGTAILGNFVGVSNGNTYNGIIYANAALEFYPASFTDPAPRVPDVVVGMPGNSGSATLGTTASQLSQTITFPTNVESAYLDVISQSQSDDEFWYFSVPNDIATALANTNVGLYGNTGFREAEISIDGQPAGVAPVYPWIYTGGYDPDLWFPIPGVQTLNFKPYRVDLTPFAGLLSNGQQHTVAVSVFNANSYFSETATLLLYTDHHAKKVTGGILSNNLTAEPSPSVKENVTLGSPGTSNASVVGTVTTTSARDFSITGYVNTSHGRVETTVSQKMSFSSLQTMNLNVTPTTYIQDVTQSTTVQAKTTTRAPFQVTETVKNYSYPFTFNVNQTPNANGSINLDFMADQKYLVNEQTNLDGWNIFSSQTSNHVSTQDDMEYASISAQSPSSDTLQSSQTYTTQNSNGYCYSDTLTTKNNALTTDTKGKDCPDHNHGSGGHPWSWQW